jgi:acyl-CoA thioesterase FadM
MVYPYHRVLWLLIRGLVRRREQLDPLKEFEWRIRPGFGDIDLYPEVNNGRHFVLFDLARYDLAVRLGLFRWVRRTKAAFVVGGSSIRYRHRLRPWRKVTVRTRLVGIDDRFFYFEQCCIQHGRTCSHALVRTGVRRRGAIPPRDVMTAIGMEVDPFMEPWVEAWNDWDNERNHDG